jgi:exopolysaccharide biosynthesis protein
VLRSDVYLTKVYVPFTDLGCKAAYNLDGGHSSFLTFEGKIASHPYKPKTKISDCIYLAEPQKPKTVAATGGVR